MMIEDDTDFDPELIDSTDAQPDDMLSDDAELMMQAPVDAYALFFSFVKIAANPRSAKRILRELRDAAHVAASERASLAAARAEHDAQLVRPRRYCSRAYQLREAQADFEDKKEGFADHLVEREKRVSEFEKRIERYRWIAEEDDVTSGFRAAEFSALFKFRAAHGYTVDSPHALDDIANQMNEKFPRNVRTDPQGVDFPAHTTISRIETAPDPATVSVRVRSKRGAAHAE